LDEHSVSYLGENDRHSQRYLEAGSQRGRRSSTPLLVGLVDSAHARQSLDQDFNGLPADIDLEEIAKKRVAGGGMIDSVANMANSILGAGMNLL
jgi:solute carrier family 38 (sodium-coupled neutral amino acid transporter), member 11